MTKELTPASADYLIELGLSIREFTAIRKIISKIISAKKEFDSTYIVSYSRDLNMSEWEELISKFRGSLLIVSNDAISIEPKSKVLNGYYYEDHTGLHFIKDRLLR